MLFRKSANGEYPTAYYILGRCYENGWGVTQDKDEAMRLYNDAAAQGDEQAQKRLDELAHPAPSGGVGFVDKYNALSDKSLGVIIEAMQSIKDRYTSDIFTLENKGRLIGVLKDMLANKEDEARLIVFIVEQGYIADLKANGSSSSAPYVIKGVLVANGLGGAAADEFIEKLREVMDCRASSTDDYTATSNTAGEAANTSPSTNGGGESATQATADKDGSASVNTSDGGNIVRYTGLSADEVVALLGMVAGFLRGILRGNNLLDTHTPMR